MTSSRTDRTTLTLLGLSVGGLLAVAALIWLAESSRSTPERTPTSPTTDTTSRPSTHFEDDRNPERTAANRRPHADERPSNTTPAADNLPPPTDTGVPPTQPDAHANSPYSDPVNRRVLGPTSWMATPDDTTSAAIQRELHRDVSDPTTFAVSRRDRRLAISRLQQAARNCADQHLPSERRGHLVIRATLVVTDDRAELRDVTLDDILRLDDPAFQRCVKQRASDIQFDGRRSGRLSIATGFRR